LTTLFAEFTLDKDYLTEAEPRLKKLFEWHSAEEIEHKSVAYNVLQNATNSYQLRLLGMLISHILILSLLNLGLLMLLYQDKKLLDRKVWQEMLQFWFIKEKLLLRGLRNSLDYSKKNFHPSQRDNLFLIKKVIG
jgi:predicted metal-dependent hydrolase